MTVLSEIAYLATQGRIVTITASTPTPSLSSTDVEIVVEDTMSKLQINQALDKIENTLKSALVRTTGQIRDLAAFPFADGAYFADGANFGDQGVRT